MRPNTRNPTFIAALHLALFLAASVLGAGTGTVDGVLEKYVKAIGGKEAWNKVASRSIKAEFEDPTGATSGWSLQAKAPNKRLTRMESSPWGVLLDGFDGTTAWSRNQNGVQTKAGDELSHAEKEADFRREVRLKELYPDLVFKGTETLDGEEVQVLESKPTPSSKERFSFSAKTGFLVRRQSEFKKAEGNDTRVEIRYSEYRAVDGLQYPHIQRFKYVVAGGEIELGMKIKEVKHNEKLEDSIFSKPST
jgi:outer membrane lipoprotein-sorting protein